MTNEIDRLMNSYKVLSDRQVLHRANTKGTVVTRVQIVEMDGRRFENKYWTDWETGTTIRIEGREIKSSQ